jgi:hypothetical protein
MVKVIPVVLLLPAIATAQTVGARTTTDVRREAGGPKVHGGGVADLRGGLKNGVETTVAGTRWRTASIVSSMSRRDPSL